MRKHNNKIKVLPLPTYWDGYLSGYYNLEDVIYQKRPNQFKVRKIKPIFNKTGWYLQRIGARYRGCTPLCWVELGNGEAYTQDPDKFKKVILDYSTKTLSANEVKAIKELTKNGHCPKSLQELLELSKGLRERKRIYYSSLKFMLDGLKEMKKEE